MLRRDDKVLEIAKNVIPGLKNYIESNSSVKKRDLPKDDLELKIVSINEKRGKQNEKSKRKT